VTKWLLPAAAAGLILAGRAPAQDDAKEVIKKAIAAHGGEDKLAKFKGAKAKAKGTITIQGQAIEFTSESVSMRPDKAKNLINAEVMNMPIKIEQVWSGKKFRQTINGMEQPMNDDLKKEQEQALKLQSVSDLIPLLTEPGWKLEIGDANAKVGDSPAVAVKVSGNGLNEIKLYFDKKTNLLVKLERQGLDPQGESGKQESVFSNFKEFDGIKRPTKTVVTQDGKKFLETEVTEHKHFEKIDDKEFAD
jgi:hypothetical protein